MVNKTHFTRIVFFLLLGWAVSCSNSPPPADPVSDKKTKSAELEQAALHFQMMCKDFFDLGDQVKDIYLGTVGESTSALMSKSFQTFSTKLSENYGLDTKDVGKAQITPQDCSAMLTLMSKIQSASSIEADYSAYYKKILGGTPAVFSELAFVFQNVFNEYMLSFDFFGRFSATYSNYFRYRASENLSNILPSGIHLLERPEYREPFFIDSKQTADIRKPKYLFVNYSPDYLSDDLPTGSRIFKVNGKSVSSMYFEDAIREFNRSDKISIEFQRPREDGYGPMEIQSGLALENVKVPRETVFRLLSNGSGKKIGYLRIPSFVYRVTDLENDFLKTWAENLDSELATGLDGTIIDLRGNSGGTIKETIQFLNAILPEDSLVGFELNKDGELAAVRTPESYKIKLGRLVLLVDYQTASAAEIVAAALKDHGAAFVVGEKTFGKGIGQMQIPVDSISISGRVHVTIGYFYSPMGTSWYLKGVLPDTPELIELSHANHEWRLDSLQDRLPPSQAAITLPEHFVSHYGSEEHQYPLSTELRAYLTNWYENEKAADRIPAECSCVDPSDCVEFEERSCYLSWGQKILAEWIRVTPESL